METEQLHARPAPGQTASPCCGRTLAELPRYDRISPDDAHVTCGRLSGEDLMLLSGQPIVTDPGHEQAVFAMASTVASLSGGVVTLDRALTGVDQAVREIVTGPAPLQHWSAQLMVAVTTRAQQIVRR